MGHELFPFFYSIVFPIISALSSDKIHGSLSNFNLGALLVRDLSAASIFLQASGASNAFGSMFLPREWIISKNNVGELQRSAMLEP